MNVKIQNIAVVSCMQFIFFWVITRRLDVVRNRRFGPIVLFIFRVEKLIIFSTLKMGRKIGSEMSVLTT
jgi:hypothetical protein